MFKKIVLPILLLAVGALTVVLVVSSVPSPTGPDAEPLHIQDHQQNNVLLTFSIRIESFGGCTYLIWNPVKTLLGCDLHFVRG